jgi:hypothetical protein
VLGVSGEGVFVLEFMRVDGVGEGWIRNVVVVDGLVDFNSFAQVEHVKGGDLRFINNSHYFI